MAIQPFNQPQFGMQQQQQGQQPQAKRQRGTGFTNIGRMLGANIGAGQQMAQQVGKTIGAQAGQVQQGALKSQQAFKTGFEAAKEKGLQDIGKVSGLAGQVGETGQVGTGLSGMSEEEAKRLGQQFAETKYTGPMGLEGQVGQRAQSLKGLGQQAITGQRELIGSTLARRGPYTRGQSLLDTSLVGQDKAAQEALRASALEAMRTGTQAQQQEAAAKSLVEGAQALIGGDQQKGSLKAEAEKQLLGGMGAIEEAGKKQAESFSKEAGRVQELMAGTAKDASGNLITSESQLSEEDKNLIENINRFMPKGMEGLEDLYVTDENRRKAILGDISSKLSMDVGGKKYEGGQKEALRNLALLTRQEDVAKRIAEEKAFEGGFEKSGAVEKAKGYKTEDIKSLETAKDQYKKASELLSLADLATKNVAVDRGKIASLLSEVYPQLKAELDASVPQGFRDQMYALAAREFLLPQIQNYWKNYQDLEKKVATPTEDIRKSILKRYTK